MVLGLFALGMVASALNFRTCQPVFVPRINWLSLSALALAGQVLFLFVIKRHMAGDGHDGEVISQILTDTLTGIASMTFLVGATLSLGGATTTAATCANVIGKRGREIRPFFV